MLRKHSKLKKNSPRNTRNPPNTISTFGVDPGAKGLSPTTAGQITPHLHLLKTL